MQLDEIYKLSLAMYATIAISGYIIISWLLAIMYIRINNQYTESEAIIIGIMWPVILFTIFVFIIFSFLFGFSRAAVEDIMSANKKIKFNKPKR